MANHMGFCNKNPYKYVRNAISKKKIMKNNTFIMNNFLSKEKSCL
ncbi:MAG: hypothetical protein QXL18_00665 [Candidatus Woesearchaeota archaeon]